MERRKPTYIVHRNKNFEPIRLSALGIALLLITSPMIARAGDDPCGKDKEDTMTQQKKQYCNAAKAADKAAKANQTIGIVYAGVSAVCTTACAMSYWPGSQTYGKVCTGVSLAGAVTDAVITKEYAGAMMSLMSTGGGMMMNKSLHGNYFGGAAKTAANAGKGSVKNMDISSCLSAAVSVFQTFQNFNSAANSKKTAKENRNAAASLISPGGNIGMSDIGVSGADTAKSLQSGQSGAGTREIASQQDSSEKGADCGGGNAQAVVSCAVAHDPNLPPFVKSPEFLKELEQVTGKSADEFFRESDPSRALASGVGANFNAEGAAKVASLIQNAEQDIGDSATGSTYAGGGRGGRSGGGDDQPLDEMVAGLLNKMMPKTAEEKKHPGVKELAFGKIARAPSAAAEDVSISLFDRVAYRYRINLNKLERMQWALPQNQLLTGSRTY